MRVTCSYTSLCYPRLSCAGYYVNSSSVPKLLRWLPKASLIKHAFEALCVNEFRGLNFEPSARKSSGDALTGEQVCHITLLHTRCLPMLAHPLSIAVNVQFASMPENAAMPQLNLLMRYQLHRCYPFCLKLKGIEGNLEIL